MSFRPAARQFFERRGAPTPPLPYDADVEYVAIGAGQICNLGIQPTVETLFNVRAAFAVTNGNLHFGIKKGEYASFRIFYWVATLYFDLGDYYGQGGRIQVGSLVLNTRYDMEFGNNYVLIGGVEVARKTRSTTTLDTGEFQFGPGASKVYSAQLSNGGVLQRDLIPVRLGRVGYFYDRVSGGMFGASTGSLTPGPDKS